MHNSVVIKGNKSGMSVYLDPEIPFSELVENLKEKFTASAKFWGAAQMTLSFVGRELTDDEQLVLVNTITEASQIEILCLLDTDHKQIEKCEKALRQRLMELSFSTGQFYKGSLKRGDSLDVETSIVIIGNVEHGARVTAKGNIIILGRLCGTVSAGIAGNHECVVAALEMMPMQITIAGISAVFNRKKHTFLNSPMIAAIEEQKICIKSFKKSILNLQNIN